MFRATGYGVVPGVGPICLDRNDPITVLDGFTKRLGRDVPKAQSDKIARLKKFVRRYCEKNLPKVPVLGFEEWLSTTSYTDVRKDELRKVFEELRGGVPTRKEASRVSSFIKTEYYPALKQARWINARCDKAKVFMGPRAKAVEQAVYQLKEFVKHVPVQERPARLAALRRAGSRYFLTDYEAFESHFTKELMEAVECEVYRYVLSEDVHVELMCQILTGLNRLRTRNGFMASVEARRMSGDMVTSLGNGLTNWLVAAFLAEEQGAIIEGVVEGDDGLFACDKPLREQDFAAVGLTIKIIEVNDPVEVIPLYPALDQRLGVHAGAFCGICASSDGTILRDPRAFAMGFGWTSSFINAGPRIMKELARAKALSACFETPQCPIIGAMARRVLKDTIGACPRFIYDGYHTLPRDAREVPDFQPSDAARQLFSVHFGISQTEQLAIERKILSGDFDVAADMGFRSDVHWYAARFIEVG